VVGTGARVMFNHGSWNTILFVNSLVVVWMTLWMVTYFWTGVVWLIWVPLDEFGRKRGNKTSHTTCFIASGKTESPRGSGILGQSILCTKPECKYIPPHTASQSCLFNYKEENAQLWKKEREYVGLKCCCWSEWILFSSSQPIIPWLNQSERGRLGNYVVHRSRWLVWKREKGVGEIQKMAQK
jgi:hypothetical protein